MILVLLSPRSKNLSDHELLNFFYFLFNDVILSFGTVVQTRSYHSLSNVFSENNLVGRV